MIIGVPFFEESVEGDVTLLILGATPVTRITSALKSDAARYTPIHSSAAMKIGATFPGDTRDMVPDPDLVETQAVEEDNACTDATKQASNVKTDGVCILLTGDSRPFAKKKSSSLSRATHRPFKLPVEVAKTQLYSSRCAIKPGAAWNKDLPDIAISLNL